MILISLQRCDLINPSEGVPAYIHIDSFTLKGNYDTVGSLSHKITDAWIIVDDQFIGTFELPCTFPVLEKGEHQITIRAGVYENGISNVRDVYPFYNYYTINHNFTEKKVDTIHPVINYLVPAVKYEFLEDFETSRNIFKKTSSSTIDYIKTDSASDVFEGRYSLKATLDTAYDLFEIETYNNYILPRNKSAFLELNYKSDITFQIGYIAYNPYTGDQNKHLFLYLNPSQTWKKIYVNFGTEVNFESSLLIFKVVIGTMKTDNSSLSHIYLDNIKLICFE